MGRKIESYYSDSTEEVVCNTCKCMYQLSASDMCGNMMLIDSCCMKS